VTQNVGFAAVLAGDLDGAEPVLEESVRLFRELSDLDGLAYAFAAQAELRARRREWPEAVQLLAAAQYLLAEAGTALEPVERRLYEATLETVRQELSEEAFDRAWDEGRLLADAELNRR